MDDITERRNAKRVAAVLASGIASERLAFIAAGGGGLCMKGQNIRLPDGMVERVDVLVEACERDPDVARVALGYGAVVNRSALLRAALDRGLAALEVELTRRGEVDGRVDGRRLA